MVKEMAEGLAKREVAKAIVKQAATQGAGRLILGRAIAIAAGPVGWIAGLISTAATAYFEYKTATWERSAQEYINRTATPATPLPAYAPPPPYPLGEEGIVRYKLPSADPGKRITLPTDDDDGTRPVSDPVDKIPLVLPAADPANLILTPGESNGHSFIAAGAFKKRLRKIIADPTIAVEEDVQRITTAMDEAVRSGEDPSLLEDAIGSLLDLPDDSPVRQVVENYLREFVNMGASLLKILSDQMSIDDLWSNLDAAAAKGRRFSVFEAILLIFQKSSKMGPDEHNEAMTRLLAHSSTLVLNQLFHVLDAKGIVSAIWKGCWPDLKIFLQDPGRQETYFQTLYLLIKFAQYGIPEAVEELGKSIPSLENKAIRREVQSILDDIDKSKESTRRCRGGLRFR